LREKNEGGRDREGDEVRLVSETVEGLAGALEGVDDVEGGDGLALGVLSVGDGVADDVLKEREKRKRRFEDSEGRTERTKGRRRRRRTSRKILRTPRVSS
jgi:hypothetical protein